MKKTFSFLCLACAILCIFLFSGCRSEKQKDPLLNTDGSAADPMRSRVSSVETYNRTGKIQRQDFYAASKPTNQAEDSIEYSIEYSYDDSGRLTEIKQTGGDFGSNRPIETYLYSGDTCTQHVLYDKNGSTQKVFYWKYDKKGNLLTERIVTMLPSSAGTGYNGKSEELTEYDEKGLAKRYTYAAEGEYSRSEYGYDAEGNRVTENVYFSSDGETYLFLENRTREYDENGKLCRELKKDSSGQPTYLRVYTYDPEEHILCDTVYSDGTAAEESIASQTKYEYNPNGSCSFKVCYTGNRSTQTYYEYDSFGNCIRVSDTEYLDGISQGTTVTQTEYDSRSNAVFEKETDPKGKEEVRFRCEYEYYDDGKIKRKTNYEG